jgi:hypothetical protein
LADARIPLGLVYDARPADLTLLSPLRRDVLREARARVAAASYGAGFDPRTYLQQEGRALVEWRAARLAWLVELFADDPRIVPAGQE